LQHMPAILTRHVLRPCQHEKASVHLRTVVFESECQPNAGVAAADRATRCENVRRIPVEREHRSIVKGRVVMASNMRKSA